jgi:hypothetical protein
MTRRTGVRRPVFRRSAPEVTQVAVRGDASGMATEGAQDRQVRGRWISADSAERNLGLLRPGELAQLRTFGTVRYASAGTVAAAAGTQVTEIQIVGAGELELRARLDAIVGAGSTTVGA